MARGKMDLDVHTGFIRDKGYDPLLQKKAVSKETAFFYPRMARDASRITPIFPA
jgi:hypothetical protein